MINKTRTCPGIFNLPAILFACILFTQLPCQGIAQTQQQYNVLLISIDDMADKVPYLGYPAVLTPNLQRLLNRGTGFTAAYDQFPICNPSRVSMMSGWRPDKTQVFGNGDDPAVKVPSGVNYLQEYLHGYGYRTERYGKIYHAQFEYEFSWDYAESDSSSGGDLKIAAGANAAAPSSWGINYDSARTSLHGYNLTTDFVNRLQQPITQPTFFALGLSTHNPFTPNIEFWNYYGDATKKVALPFWKRTGTILGNSASIILLPATPANDKDDIPPIAFRPENIVIQPDSTWRKAVQAYYGEVTFMDANLGRVLDVLDQKNLWANTVVVFIPDHGQHLGEHGGEWLKNTLFEESLHIPFIICAPGKPVAICNKLVEIVDIFPSITELCKIPTPPDLEGSSLVRLLDKPEQLWKRATFSQVRTSGNTYPLVDKGVGVHSGNYHYNNWGVYGEELYDLVNDPHEYTNLVSNATYAIVLTDMRTIFSEGWQKSKPPACDSLFYFKDNDGDGYGNAGISYKGCYQIMGYVSNSTDCNDNNPAINPGAVEVCDGIDNNCDGNIDEGFNLISYYRDADTDGYGNINEVVIRCEPLAGYVLDNTDCDDNNAAVYPGAIEICDGLDNNCDGNIDEGFDLISYYRDEDADGYGNIYEVVIRCEPLAGYVLDNTDCDDNNATVYPGAIEICDGLDNNCDGNIDEGFALISYYRDADADGYGNINDAVSRCEPLLGYVLDNTDCDDNNAAVYPGAIEICDGLDNNCDGNIDEGVVTVSITPSPSISICKGKTTILSASATAGTTYQWLLNSLPVAGALSSTYTAGTAGNYQVTATLNNRCSATSSITVVTVVNTPSAKITASGSLDICATASVVLKANSGNGFTYQWKKGNVDILGAISKSYTATAAATYKVEVKNSTGCTKTSSGIIVTNSCISVSKVTDEINAAYKNENSLLVIPNPGNGNINVSFASTQAGKIILRIYTIEGKEIMTIPLVCIKGNNRYPLHLQQLSAGIYFIELENSNTSVRTRLVIQK